MASAAAAVLAAAPTGVSLSCPTGIAFDASGNLWVVNDLGNSLVRYSAAQWVGAGNPVPDGVLNVTPGALKCPQALAFDSSGNLYASNFGNNTVVKFTPAQLAGTRSTTPVIF